MHSNQRNELYMAVSSDWMNFKKINLIDFEQGTHGDGAFGRTRHVWALDSRKQDVAGVVRRRGRCIDDGRRRRQLAGPQRRSL